MATNSGRWRFVGQSTLSERLDYLGASRLPEVDLTVGHRYLLLRQRLGGGTLDDSTCISVESASMTHTDAFGAFNLAQRATLVSANSGVAHHFAR